MGAVSGVVDGKIYVIGGCPFGYGTAYKSVYEYNPATNMWQRKSDMPTARFFASATVVDGKIYVFGGAASMTGIAFSAVEAYDPSIDTWTPKGAMPIHISTQASTAVDGKIFVISGGPAMGSINDEVLEYNPSLDSWATKANIPIPRVAPVACTVAGKLYVIGGMDVANTRLSTVEEYDPASEATSVGEVYNASLPMQFSLLQNFPNPFNPSTTIKYELPISSEVDLRVYDLLGRPVSLIVHETKNAGFHETKFDASGLSSGVYVYTLKAGDFVLSRKMLLLR